jgi:hypothetical protein
MVGANDTIFQHQLQSLATNGYAIALSIATVAMEDHQCGH